MLFPPVPEIAVLLHDGVVLSCQAGRTAAGVLSTDGLVGTRNACGESP